MHVDSHAVNERFRLLTHKSYAKALDLDPTLVGRAREIVTSRLDAPDATMSDRMWAVLLTMSVADVKRAMTHDSPDGRTLRSGSPFSRLLGIRDKQQRIALWERARAELSTRRT